ncbi:hypothetical protein BD626DRAFT_514930 [Schizophyllum amplum]|uniref:Uncharacterized protein n=1 Tax=Schizophyllum amplum TaxID=97359 RepID=A0A550BY69_9AGAR|nr:hypothetical protein BD626DRAFT_514930 [Auriculariopsis ampla]
MALVAISLVFSCGRVALGALFSSIFVMRFMRGQLYRLASMVLSTVDTESQAHASVNTSPSYARSYAGYTLPDPGNTPTTTNNSTPRSSNNLFASAPQNALNMSLSQPTFSSLSACSLPLLDNSQQATYVSRRQALPRTTGLRRSRIPDRLCLPATS